jgi:lysophospholipase L1-like esterase
MMTASRLPARLRTLALGAALLLPAARLTGAAAADACIGLPARQPMPRAALPQPSSEPPWQARQAELERALDGPEAARAQLLFLGDSLVHFWPPAVYDLFYGHRRPLNAGISGDTTQGLLWRLQRMPLGRTLRPRLAVMLIGTNNAAGGRPEDIALGIAEAVREIRRRSSGTRVLLIGLLPRGAGPEDPLRMVNERVNALVAGCADGRSVFFATPGELLVDAAGRLPEPIAQDRLHPSWVGYGILSAALEPEIRRLLGD